LRTTIGVFGAPKRVITCSIQRAVDLLSQPRCEPQPVQVSLPAWGPRAAPMVQTLLQHGPLAIDGTVEFHLEADQRRVAEQIDVAYGMRGHYDVAVFTGGTGGFRGRYISPPAAESRWLRPASSEKRRAKLHRP
jgi:hypothetical protein